MKLAKTLEEDIDNQINAGFTKYEIKQNLLMKGISEDEIDKTFEKTNFQQAASSRQNGVSYKSIIITIILILVSTFKIVRCISNLNRNQPTGFEQNTINLPVSNYSAQTNIRILAAQGEKLIYKDYAELNISDIPLESYKIVKFKNDTSIYFDLNTKLKIKKNTFYYNNHDERLRMALKGEDNINVFIYDFEGIGNLLEEFKASKNKGQYEFLSKESTKNITIINYNYIASDISYKGCAFAFKQDKNYEYFAFESNNLTIKELKKAGLSFLLNSLTKI